MNTNAHQPNRPVWTLEEQGHVGQFVHGVLQNEDRTIAVGTRNLILNGEMPLGSNDSQWLRMFLKELPESAIWGSFDELEKARELTLKVANQVRISNETWARLRGPSKS